MIWFVCDDSLEIIEGFFEEVFRLDSCLGGHDPHHVVSKRTVHVPAGRDLTKRARGVCSDLKSPDQTLVHFYMFERRLRFGQRGVGTVMASGHATLKVKATAEISTLAYSSLRTVIDRHTACRQSALGMLDSGTSTHLNLRPIGIILSSQSFFC